MVIEPTDVGGKVLVVWVFRQIFPSKSQERRHFVVKVLGRNEFPDVTTISGKKVPSKDHHPHAIDAAFLPLRFQTHFSRYGPRQVAPPVIVHTVQRVVGALVVHLHNSTVIRRLVLVVIVTIVVQPLTVASVFQSLYMTVIQKVFPVTGLLTYIESGVD
jgi:hypothetical protein